jgi:sigma-B regulation protein RsbU (phosphoserine phosphatase)
VAEEQPIRVVVSHEDITALKLAEEALRKREKERDRLRHSLELAREVQQVLLPKDNPGVSGLDVAGKSIYCDETGGDYYDFIEFKESDNEKLGVVVGDVAGHGISSALLMATLRSALRQRIALPGPISQVIADVNNQLVGDFAESGQFATLFYLSIDTFRRTIEWVRAGHDPAIYYDPAADKFLELDGFGMALGIEKDSQYEANRQNDFSRGSIIVLGTDGIWETRNEGGQMFGRSAMYDFIRKHSAAGANDIMEVILKEINKFSKAGKPEDDVTLVVIKIL